ncbi:MAG: hypothetical protein P1P76_04610 [Anaerolineales bacterium]|nr:hypothetical protein [Anaerolineales bacterium]
MESDEIAAEANQPENEAQGGTETRAVSGRQKLWLVASLILNVVLSVSLVLVLFTPLDGGVSSNPRPSGPNAKLGSGIQGNTTNRPDAALSIDEVYPQSYDLGSAFGDLGPQLVEAGAIDVDALRSVYLESAAPLTSSQERVLAESSAEGIVLTRGNARFLLHFFWALGLTNQNAILTEGPMWTSSEGAIERFASTGGWTLAEVPVTELYASAPIVVLTPAQQARLETVAANVYRPCCNNPTLFPDCNHGMAMLGLLQVLAAEDASEAEMYEAAKVANMFWFPAQTVELAMFFNAVLEQPFDEVDAKMAVGPEAFSGSGFASVHRWLGENGFLEQAPEGGSSCGV